MVYRLYWCSKFYKHITASPNLYNFKFFFITSELEGTNLQCPNFSIIISIYRGFVSWIGEYMSNLTLTITSYCLVRLLFIWIIGRIIIRVTFSFTIGSFCFVGDQSWAISNSATGTSTTRSKQTRLGRRSWRFCPQVGLCCNAL